MSFEYKWASERMTNGVIASDDTGFSPGAARAWRGLLESTPHVFIGSAEPSPHDGLQAIWKGTQSEMWRRMYLPEENGHR
jgi:hypothetical protein